jgi:hypothetical protein
MKQLTITISALIISGCTVPVPLSQRNTIPIHKNTIAPTPGTRHIYTISPTVPLQTIYSAEQAKAIVEEFRITYAKLGGPKIDVRVNFPRGAVQVPQLPTVGVGGIPAIDPTTGLPVPAGDAPTPTADGIPTVPSLIFDTDELSSQQTKSEVERLFGRPLRMAGVTLMDTNLTTLPEVSFEVLMSEREITVNGIKGRQSQSVPDIQVTAIRVADGRIIGQATVLDLFPKRSTAARMLQRYDIQQLTEATALALMKDISSSAQ